MGTGVAFDDYTLERDNRELQQRQVAIEIESNYTLERDNRELQRVISAGTIRAELYP